MIIIDGYTIDAALSEEHAFDSEVTMFPVESGADITDHVRAQPITVTIEGVVSDTPIGLMRDVRNGTTTLPSNDALAKLIEIRDAREPITVETTLRVYDNMVMTSLQVPQNSKIGDALRFKAVFTQIHLVTNERTVVVTSSPRGQKKRNVGNMVLIDLPGVDPISVGTVRDIGARLRGVRGPIRA